MLWIKESLRRASAMGIDKLIHVISKDALRPLEVSKVLKDFAKKEEADVVILGKQAIDDDCNETVINMFSKFYNISAYYL